MATKTAAKKRKGYYARRAKKRKGKVIFIAHYPDGMKEWLEERAARNEVAMSAEAVSILEAERARDFARPAVRGA